ncbi:MAG: TlpA family protein disulfide reductase [Deltaproteobacteria bacterium]|nr:TlpA family protein disulfide reductase [Deltaproteobacteria bacterium]
MADQKTKDLPVATALPPKTPERSVLIDPVAIVTGSAVALLGIGVLVAFLWMVPSAAARESQAACRGLGGYNDPVPALCPGGEPCTLPIPAPDFTARDITGKQVSLRDFRGKVVLLNFWASWCAVCKTEKPSLSDMAGDLGSDDFVVLTLASDHNIGEAMTAVMQSLAPGAALPQRDANGQVSLPDLKAAFDRALPNNIPFKVFLDPPQGDDNIGPITQRWGIKAVPESALIDRKGNIRAYFVNKRDWSTPVARTCLHAVIDE